jgi:hypothetical protein
LLPAEIDLFAEHLQSANQLTAVKVQFTWDARDVCSLPVVVTVDFSIGVYVSIRPRTARQGGRQTAPLSGDGAPVAALPAGGADGGAGKSA